jgi:TolB-like protein/Flp pilus assembly protein TadD
LHSKAAGAVLQKGSAVLSLEHRNKRRRILAWLALIPALGALLIALFLFFNRGPHEMAPLAEKGVAVLPFDNLSANKDDGYFADGVQDEILNNLAKIAQLKVISRTSVMQYRADVKRNLRQIANALGVANVLEGTVRREGNRVRVSTELIDARKDQTIWADSYDRDLNGIFAIQSDVAQTIAAKLAATLSPAEKNRIEAKPTSNLEAYDLYLRGKELVFNALVLDMGVARKERLLNAVGIFEKATQLDPSFTLAYCASAEANDLLYFWYDHTPERLALADAAINAALRLQPDLPEVHSYAKHLYRGYRNYDGARVQLAIAKRGLPNSVDVMNLEAYIDRRQGNMEKAVQGFKEALARDPRNLESLVYLADTLCGARQFDAAIQLYDRIIDLWPDQPMYRVSKAEIRYDKTGDTDPVWSAIGALPESVAVNPDVLDTRVWFYLVDENWTQAEQLIEKMKGRDTYSLGYSDRLVPAEWRLVLLARVRNDQHAPTATFTEVREQLNQRVLDAPQDAELLSALAVLDALLSKKRAAISEARRAAEILPVSKDAYKGPGIMKNFAIVCTWTGESDLAFGTLKPLCKLPFGNLLRRTEARPVVGTAPRRSSIQEAPRRASAKELRTFLPPCAVLETWRV